MRQRGELRRQDGLRHGLLQAGELLPCGTPRKKRDAYEPRDEDSGGDRDEKPAESGFPLVLVPGEVAAGAAHFVPRLAAYEFQFPPACLCQLCPELDYRLVHDCALRCRSLLCRALGPLRLARLSALDGPRACGALSLGLVGVRHLKASGCLPILGETEP